jgi:hypothetical protein
MGLIWAAGWGCIGGAIELLDNIVPNLPLVTTVDMWIQSLAIPGFIAGAIFSTLLWIGDGRRRFSELSFPRMITWGAFGGVALGMLGLSAGLLQTAVPNLLLRTVAVLTPLGLLCGASAAATLALARLARDTTALPAGQDAESPVLPR